MDGGTGGAPTGPVVGGAAGALGATAPPLVGPVDVLPPAEAIDVPAPAEAVDVLAPAEAVDVPAPAGAVGVPPPAEPWARWLPVAGIDCVAVAGGVAPEAAPVDAASSPDEDSVRTEP